MAVDPMTLMRTARITTSLAARSFANEHRTSTAGSGIVSSTQGVHLKARAKISRVSGAASLSRDSASAYNRSSVKVGPGGCRWQLEPRRASQANVWICRMADVHWADRHAVDGMFIREVLLTQRNEVTASVTDSWLGSAAGAGAGHLGSGTAVIKCQSIPGSGRSRLRSAGLAVAGGCGW